LIATLDTPAGIGPIAASLPTSAEAMPAWIRELPPEAQAEAQQKVLQTQAQLAAIMEKAQRELFEIQDRVEKTLPKSAPDAAPVIDEPTLSRDSLVAQVAGKRVVMVNELRPPLAPDVATMLRTYGKRLERLGINIVGEAPWRAADADEIELVATLRNACGTTPSDTVEFGEHVRAWLEEREPDTEAWAILWVAATPEGKARLHLVGPLDSDGNPDAALRAQLLDKLSGDGSAGAAKPKSKSGKNKNRTDSPAKPVSTPL
jgi:hypothetical protein